MRFTSKCIAVCVFAGAMMFLASGEAKNVKGKKKDFVGGGDGNSATGGFTAIPGGSNNTANAPFAVVGGGDKNTASGTAATVPGGENNQAAGEFSLAAGQHANAIFDGSFVWADATPGDFASTATNQFRVRASGGVDLQTAGAGLLLDGNSIKPLLAGQGITIVPSGSSLQITASGSGIGFTNVVLTTRTVSAGAGLLGGGSLASNLTFSINPAIVVTAGAPISVLANNVNFIHNNDVGVALNGIFSGAFIGSGAGLSNVVPASRLVTAGRGLTGGGPLSGNINLTIDPVLVVTAGAPVTALANNAGYITNSESGVILSGSFNGSFNGSVSGNGSGLTNVVPTSRTITAGAGLLGGGTLASNVTLSLDATIMITNGQSGVNLGGIFGGLFNGGSLSNVNKIVVLSNDPSGPSSVVGGGSSNAASAAFATVGGGQFNSASGTNSVVGGGDANEALGEETTVAGGTMNTASGHGATVGGGFDNTASGLFATVCGGSNNVASGLASIVAGGAANTAAGDHSFVAGLRASATNSGCFVWSDASTNAVFASGTNNQFSVRASGGVRICTDITTTNGVVLHPGDVSWSSLSDRAVKENFKAVDGKAILDQLSRMPISEWNLKAQDPSIRHVGPVAQDFYAAFGMGQDDRHINTTDSEGVALAAIQGLYQMMKEQQKEIVALRRQNAVLATQVLELKEHTPAAEPVVNPASTEPVPDRTRTAPGHL